MSKYDVIIIGAGPAGVFSAIEFVKNNSDKKILILEKGSSIDKRKCPKRKTEVCVYCKPTCHITTGFAGAGAYSDGKLSLSPDVGGNLPEYIGYEKTKELIDYVDNIYLQFGADKKIHGIDNRDKIESIRHKAIKNNLKLIDCPIRHLGTEQGYEIYGKLQQYLIDNGIEIKFRNPVKELIIEDNVIKGVVADKEYYSDTIISAVGREGAHWLKKICSKHNIETEVGQVDIGVRVEVRDEVMEEINRNLYESKLVYYTETFDDKVRVFCSNPSGEVASEYYDNNLAVVNGHAYKSKDFKTNNTNFALLVSQNFTEPFDSPIDYGKHIARLANMLSGNKVLVQRYGDFKRGRRTTKERLYRNNIIPTLKDAVPGDLSLVLPYRIMKDLEEMIEALNGVAPGMNSDETLLYGVEVKFYSNKIKLNDRFQTNIEGLYAIGDGAGLTRGLIQASASGVLTTRNILNK